MKKLSVYFLALLLAAAMMGGCKKEFEDLSKNKNKPESAPASLVLNGILNDLYDAPNTLYERWSQYYCINYDYYGNNRYEFGEGTLYYSTLKNVLKMEEEAKKAGAKDLNAYAALGKFFRAYFFVKMTLQMGDLPMEDALKGVSNLTPRYNTQKEIFLQSFKWLEEANNDLSTLIARKDNMLNGDFYFGNDLSKWQKVVNAYRLRILVQLSRHADDPDLNIRQQFSNIISKPMKYPLLGDMNDNLQYVFNETFNKYPNNPSNFGFDALRYNTSATYVGLLTRLKDPRVFVTAEPAAQKLATGISATSFDAFVGANPGEDLGQMYVKTNNGEYSLLNRYRYYRTNVGENSIQIGYPEMCFNIAEGINRGWAPAGAKGDAAFYYLEGIKASMRFYGLPDADARPVTFYFLKKGGSLSDYDAYTVNVSFDDYYNQPEVKYAGNNAAGLMQILWQKYLALFRHSGLESYYTYRRTGVPAFQTGPGTGNSERIAKRFLYPRIERTANTAHYNDAIQRQYGGRDDINMDMWLIK